MSRNELLEALAAAEHDSWAEWMIYLFEVSTENEDGSVTIPPSRVQRWKQQVLTAYEDLSEPEKALDRAEVKRRVLPLVAEVSVLQEIAERFRLRAVLVHHLECDRPGQGPIAWGECVWPPCQTDVQLWLQSQRALGREPEVFESMAFALTLRGEVEHD